MKPGRHFWSKQDRRSWSEEKRQLKWSIIFFPLLLLLATACPNPGDEDPIDYGSGSSTIEIDFDSGTPGVDFSWSLQWSGKTTGADLLNRAAEANSKLYLNLKGGMLYGITLDSDKDGLAPVWGTDPDKPQFIDTDDTYRYGWYGKAGGNSEFDGHWGYFTAESGDEPTWSQVGMSARILTDGAVDRWQFVNF